MKNPMLYIFMRPLSGEHAYMAALVLQQTINALWRAYGDQMADFEGRVFPDEPSPFYREKCCYCDPPDEGPPEEDTPFDDEIPF